MSHNAAQARATLAALNRRVRMQAIPAAINKASHVLAQQVRANAPVDTGELVASVEQTPVVGSVVVSAKVTATGGTDQPHAADVEFGTFAIPPKPYFRPAIAQKQKEMKKIIVDGLRDALESSD